MYMIKSLAVVLTLFFISCTKDDLVEIIDPDHPVKAVYLDQKSASIEIGKSISLSYTIDPDNADNKTVSWTSSNSDVATVNGGEVRGLKLGISRITVTTIDGGKTDTCKVTVIPAIVDLLIKNIPLDWSGFFMGSNNGNSSEKPVHPVSLNKAIGMSVYEITNKQYCDMLNYALAESLLTGDFYNNHVVKNSKGFSRQLLKLDGSLNIYNKCAIQYDKNIKKFFVDGGKMNQPVVYISWYGAAFYCNILARMQGKTELYDFYSQDWSCQVYAGAGYRLATEAEWEYVARYNDNRSYPWGNGFGITYANCNREESSTTDVGSYLTGKSKLGLYDLAGNVSEWCQDWYEGRFYQNQQALLNPLGPTEGYVKVVRGGSWYYLTDFLRCSARDFAQPASMLPDLGFRIVFVEGGK